MTGVTLYRLYKTIEKLLFATGRYAGQDKDETSLRLLPDVHMRACLYADSVLQP